MVVIPFPDPNAPNVTCHVVGVSHGSAKFPQTKFCTEILAVVNRLKVLLTRSNIASCPDSRAIDHHAVANTFRAVNVFDAYDVGIFIRTDGAFLAFDNVKFLTSTVSPFGLTTPEQLAVAS